VTCTGETCATEKLKTGSSGGGITISAFTPGISFGAAYSKTATSAFLNSDGEKDPGATAFTSTPGIEPRPEASPGVGLTNSMETFLIDAPVAYATLSSGNASSGFSSARYTFAAGKVGNSNEPLSPAASASFALASLRPSPSTDTSTCAICGPKLETESRACSASAPK